MPPESRHVRPPWEDRFQTPTADDLIRCLENEQRQAFELARGSLLEIDSLEEHLAWRGIPWRWSFSYRLADQNEPPLAYLVPEPGHPRLVLPLAADAVSSQALSRIPKSLRGPIIHAPRVGETRWTAWELNAPGQVSDLIEFAQASLGLVRA